MRHVAAYLLACLGGNENPTASDLERILGSVGVEANKEKLDHVLKELEGKNVEEVIAAGKEKLAAMGTCSTSLLTEPQDVVRNNSPVPPEAATPQKEETEESDDDLGFGLFD